MNRLWIAVLIAAGLLGPLERAGAASPEQVATACLGAIEANFRADMPAEMTAPIRRACEAGLLDALSAVDLKGACAMHLGEVPPELALGAQIVCEQAAGRL